MDGWNPGRQILLLFLCVFPQKSCLFSLTHSIVETIRMDHQSQITQTDSQREREPAGLNWSCCWMLLLARVSLFSFSLLSLENNFLHPHTHTHFFPLFLLAREQKERKKSFSSFFDIKEIRDRLTACTLYSIRQKQEKKIHLEGKTNESASLDENKWLILSSADVGEPYSIPYAVYIVYER